MGRKPRSVSDGGYVTRTLTRPHVPNSATISSPGSMSVGEQKDPGITNSPDTRPLPSSPSRLASQATALAGSPSTERPLERSSRTPFLKKETVSSLRLMAPIET